MTTIICILIGINILTFLIYGIDKSKAVSQRGQSQTRLSYAERKQARTKSKAVSQRGQSQTRLSYAERKQARTKSKAKQGCWRISEATLLMLAVIGGSIGALLGMQVWHHKTMHKKFKYGLPLILLAQIALIYFINK